MYIFGGLVANREVIVTILRDPADGDDSTFTFRLNAKLKSEFSALCKHEHLSAAAALKRYMSQCVAKGRVLS